jgi:ferredoxin
MKAYVDKDLCIGCENCTLVCPGVFSMDEEGKSEPITDELSPNLEECAKEAEVKCPAGAITVE